MIPDFGEGLDSLARNVSRVDALGASYVIDPILDPLSFGFTASIERYCETRRRYPDAEMLMGLGNLTELTDADSVGINAVMAGVITELGIDYVLTTEVISWARGAVRELDLARKLMHYAFQNRMLPKGLDDGLVALKDPPFETYSEEELRDMQQQVRDKNFRIFADGEWVYVFNRDIFVRGHDPHRLFTAARRRGPRPRLLSREGARARRLGGAARQEVHAGVAAALGLSQRRRRRRG